MQRASGVIAASSAICARVRARANMLFQPGRVARAQQPLQLRRVRARKPASSTSKALRLAMQISRHISGWLEAMRVKSRNPPAAIVEQAACAFGCARPGPPAHRTAGAADGSRRRTPGRALPAACANTRAPQARQAARTRAMLRALFSGSGVSTTLRARNRSGFRRVHPAVLGAGDRVAGHELRRAVLRAWHRRARPRPAWCCRRRSPRYRAARCGAIAAMTCPSGRPASRSAPDRRSATIGRIRARFVDDTELERARQIGRAAAQADDALRRAGRFQRAARTSRRSGRRRI